MRLLVLQHITCEHPGILRSFLLEDGVTWDAVELDSGEPIPPLEAYDALWVMGGPMDVWDVEEHPWLVEEKRAIRRWVSNSIGPFSGFASATSSWPTRSGVRAARSAHPRSAS